MTPWNAQTVAAHNEKVARGRKGIAIATEAPLMTAVAILPPNKRIRQGEPKIRPWEAEWKQRLDFDPVWENVKAQCYRLRLANGAWYKADVSARNFDDGGIHLFEIKGGRKMKGYAKGILALKVAAAQYPEITFHLCYKENGAWKDETVLG